MICLTRSAHDFLHTFLCFYLFVADLELSDFINLSPCLTMRTPGQLLSLTSHLSFGSGEKKSRKDLSHASVTSNFLLAINRQSEYFFESNEPNAL